jgi:hypothetical protein
MSEHKSQRARVLAVLIAAGGAEVPSVELSRISLQYGARIKELRSLGFRIVSRTERRDGAIQGFFHLERGAGVRAEPRFSYQQELALTGEENARYPG